MSKIQQIIQSFVNIFGYKLVSKGIPKDIEKEFNRIYLACKKYTMTSMERIYSIYKSTEYIINSDIPGDFVECGVWKGGSAMAMALALKSMKKTNKKIYLYDTFEGMTEPSAKDKRIFDTTSAIDTWKKRKKREHSKWCFSSLDEVRKNMLSTGYPKENIVFIKGKVEDTIPKNIPNKIALLRLDTDWYESTYHELKHLFPLLSKKGVLIIDDYGHWEGVREAVNKYFKEKQIKMLLNRVDYSGRVGITT
ncbi:TylF/MycF family methyltransferase [Candidatus Woesearchaeota archaeon]|nr:TylF/MycF family methyltransferase [Candidatus Woesearchaeota archaeon]